jgi:hypothetical protein
MSVFPDFSLIARVRCAELNFERLVELLTNPGYITTLDTHDGASFTKVSIDQTRQDDFDALFALLMPTQLNNVKLMTDATCKGAAPGLYTTVLFNLNVIEYDEMHTLLIEINKGEL